MQTLTPTNCTAAELERHIFMTYPYGHPARVTLDVIESDLDERHDADLFETLDKTRTAVDKVLEHLEAVPRRPAQALRAAARAIEIIDEAQNGVLPL